MGDSIATLVSLKQKQSYVITSRLIVSIVFLKKKDIQKIIFTTADPSYLNLMRSGQGQN